MDQPFIPQQNNKQYSRGISVIRGTGLDLQVNRFDLERKHAFLELLEKWWPDVSRVAREIGIHPSTYHLHRHSDPWFAGEIERIRQARIDKIEGRVMEAAEDNKNFLHQAMVLRAYRPELYDRAKTIKIEGYKMSDKDRTQRTQMLENAIDAQVVQTYQDRRDKREAKIKANQEKQQALRPPE